MPWSFLFMGFVESSRILDDIASVANRTPEGEIRRDVEDTLGRLLTPSAYLLFTAFQRTWNGLL
jgi:hypothetical protein